MAVNVNKNVLWLKVPIQNFMSMQVVKPNKHFTEIIFCICLFESFSSFEVAEQLATRIVVQNKVKMVKGLEGTVKLDGMRVVLQLR